MNKLNEMIAKEKGVKVADLAQTDPDAPAKETKATKKKADAKETAAKE